MSDTLKLYHKYDEFYNMVELTPTAVRRAIADSKNYKHKLHLYNAVSRDDQFIAKKQDRESIFTKAEWSIEPCENKKINEFVQVHLWRILTNKILQEMHEALFTGFSVAEIIWEKNIPAGVKILPPQAFNFQNGVLFIYERLSHNRL